MQPMGPRTAIAQSGQALAAISGNPFANGPRADACGFADGLRRLPAFNLPYNSLSTVRGQTGILVHVHPVLPWNLKSQQPQLPRSEPDGQPTESSHLEREPPFQAGDVGRYPQVQHDLGQARGGAERRFSPPRNHRSVSPPSNRSLASLDPNVICKTRMLRTKLRTQASGDALSGTMRSSPVVSIPQNSRFECSILYTKNTPSPRGVTKTSDVLQICRCEFLVGPPH